MLLCAALIQTKQIEKKETHKGHAHTSIDLKRTAPT